MFPAYTDKLFNRDSNFVPLAVAPPDNIRFCCPHCANEWLEPRQPFPFVRRCEVCKNHTLFDGLVGELHPEIAGHRVDSWEAASFGAWRPRRADEGDWGPAWAECPQCHNLTVPVEFAGRRCYDCQQPEGTGYSE